MPSILPSGQRSSNARAARYQHQPGENGKPKVVASYDYEDERGKLLFQAVRLEPGDNGAPKTFRQRRPDGRGGWLWDLKGTRLVLYHLPELVQAEKDRLIFLVEGEKDVDNLRALGLLATTNPMGALKWRDEYAEDFDDRNVVVIPDNDEVGRRHIDKVIASVGPVAKSLTVLELPELPHKGDISDWLSVPGNDKSRLLELVKKAKPHQTRPAPADGLVTTCLATIRPVPVRWLVPGYLPLGKLVLLAGDGGHGKSTLTLDITACLTTGRACLGLEHEPLPRSRVLLISCEDDYADTVVPRLLSAGADLTQVWKVDGIKGKDGKAAPFCLGHYQSMEAELRAHPDIRAVVIDPAGAYIGRSGVDDNNDTELRSLLGPLAELAARTQVTVLLVKHLVKGATAKAVHKVSGSAGYVNSVRAAFVVTPTTEDPDQKLFLPLKFNLGPRPSGLAYRIRSLVALEQHDILDAYSKHLDVADRERLASQLCRIEWQGQVSDTADAIMADWNQRDRGPGKVEQAAEWLEGFVVDYAYPSAEVFAAGLAAGHSKDNVFRARRDKLPHKILASNKGRFGGQWHWGHGDPSSWVIRPSPNNANYANNGENTDEKPRVSPIVGIVGIVGSGDAADDLLARCPFGTGQKEGQAPAKS